MFRLEERAAPGAVIDAAAAAERRRSSRCRRGGRPSSGGRRRCTVLAISPRAAPRPCRSRSAGASRSRTRVAAMVPDHGCRAEPDASSPAPADASRHRHRRRRPGSAGSNPPIARQGVCAERPSCSPGCAPRPGRVSSTCDRTARASSRRSRRSGPSPGGRDVGPADAGVVGRHEGDGQIGEPVRVGPGVVVDVGDDLARSPCSHARCCGRCSAPGSGSGSGGRRIRAAIAAVASVEPSSTTMTS